MGPGLGGVHGRQPAGELEVGKPGILLLCPVLVVFYSQLHSPALLPLHDTLSSPCQTIMERELLARQEEARLAAEQARAEIRKVMSGWVAGGAGCLVNAVPHWHVHRPRWRPC